MQLNPAFQAVELLKPHQFTSTFVANLMDEIGINNFDTPDQCKIKQLAMLESFNRLGYQISESFEKDLYASSHGSLGDDWRNRTAACYFANRMARLEALHSHRAAMLQTSMPMYLVTCAFSEDEVDPSNLPWCRPELVAARSARAVPKGSLATGGVEGVFVESAERNVIAVHTHFVVATVDVDKLQRNLRRIHKSELNRRPVRIDKIASGEEGIAINYARKRHPEKHVPYKDEFGYARRRHLPLSSKWQALYDGWLAGSQVRDFGFTVGMKRNGRFLVPS